MSLAVIIIWIIIFWGIKCNNNFTNGNYLSIEQTNSINGIFVLWVYLSHITNYIELDKWDILYKCCNRVLGQMIVTTFLFYSGYGIFFSIKTKRNYFKMIPRKIFRIWSHFACAVLFYLVINFILNIKYDAKTIFCAFLGYKSIGNSNWYIWAILLLYFFTYISYKISQYNNKKALAFLFVFCVLYCIFMKKLAVGEYYYNTIFAYFAGAFFEVYIDKFACYFSRLKKYSYIITALVLFGGWCCFFIVRETHFVFYEINSIIFCFIVLILSISFSVGNKVTKWLGEYIFEIYIIQRIPMIVLSNFMMNKNIFVLLCFFITVFLAIGFKVLENKIDRGFEKISIFLKKNSERNI